ncbi:hypothetical protein HQ586_05295, partial [Candidatus Bathyarchaeota archaeon]|nr:hypothetical protein [Candidatus Bathyarchaeota archaeon]
LSGALYAERTPEGIRFDFPRNDTFEVEPPEEVLEALGVSEPEEVQYSDTNQSSSSSWAIPGRSAAVAPTSMLSWPRITPWAGWVS